MSDIERMATVKAALSKIVDNADAPALNWCVNYAKHALTINDPEEMHGQLLRVVDNMKYWRGETAKEVRQILKNFIS